MRRLTPTEHEMQEAYFDWVRLMRNQDWRYNLVYSVPNAGKREDGQGQWMVDEGLTEGILDINIDIPTATSHGARLEFKAGKRKLTKEQAQVIQWNRKAGYASLVVRSVEFAKAATEHYMSRAIV